MCFIHDAAFVAEWSGLTVGTVHDIRAGRQAAPAKERE